LVLESLCHLSYVDYWLPASREGDPYLDNDQLAYEILNLFFILLRTWQNINTNKLKSYCWWFFFNPTLSYGWHLTGGNGSKGMEVTFWAKSWISIDCEGEYTSFLSEWKRSFHQLVPVLLHPFSILLNERILKEKGIRCFSFSFSF